MGSVPEERLHRSVYQRNTTILARPNPALCNSDTVNLITTVSTASGMSLFPMPLQYRYIEMLGANRALEWTCFRLQTPIVAGPSVWTGRALQVRFDEWK
jgi:hypothetical protein